MKTGYLKGVRSGIFPTMFRTPAYINAAMVQNQWYDVWTGLACAAGAGSIRNNVRVICMSFTQSIANETIELRFIVDEDDSTLTQVAVAATPYFLVKKAEGTFDDDPFFLTNIDVPQYLTFLFDARSCQLMVRKTSNAGANACRVKVLWGSF